MTINTVAILGAGVTGLTAAAKFTEMGYTVTLIERRKIGTDIGGGLDIHPNGTKTLFSLGIAETLKQACAFNSREIRIGTAQGQFINCVPLKLMEKRDEYPMLSLFRTDLLRILFENIKDRCKWYEETECRSIRIDESGVELNCDPIGLVRVDLLIAADGVNSIARKTFFPNSEKQYLGHIALGGRIPRELYEFNYLHGYRRTCVIFPCNETFAHTLIFCDKPAGWLKDHLEIEDRRRAFEGWSQKVDAIIAGIDPRSLFCVECVETPPLKSYVSQRIFLAGDAAHGMSPLGALATSIALEDIEELARLFADRRQGLEEIGKSYDAVRIPRAKEFRDFSVEILIPPITSHTSDQFEARIERLTKVAPAQVFAALVALTQKYFEPTEAIVTV